MRDMPELKAGMIVEYTSEEYGILGVYLYINDNWGMGLRENSKQSLSGDVFVSKIFTLRNDRSSTYRAIESNLKLLWSRKSEKDIKIEELQKTIKTMEDDHYKSLSDIKMQIEDLKNE